MNGTAKRWREFNTLYLCVERETERIGANLLQEREDNKMKDDKKCSGGKATKIDVKFPNEDPELRRYVEVC